MQRIRETKESKEYVSIKTTEQNLREKTKQNEDKQST